MTKYAFRNLFSLNFKLHNPVNQCPLFLTLDKEISTFLFIILVLQSQKDKKKYPLFYLEKKKKMKMQN